MIRLIFTATRQLQQMGEKFLAARDLGQALKYLSLAEKRRPNDPVIQYDLGLAYYERGLRIRCPYSPEEGAGAQTRLC